MTLVELFQGEARRKKYEKEYQAEGIKYQELKGKLAEAIYKELERVLYKEKSTISVKRTINLTHNMYRLNIQLPESKHIKSIMLQMDQEQQELYKIILKNF